MYEKLKLGGLFLALLFTGLTINLDAQIWTEDFEVDGEGSAYTSTGTFNDGTSDHYGRTDGSDISGGYMGQNGLFFWAGEDLDDNGGPDLNPDDTLTFATINITGVPSLLFRGLFAVGLDGQTGLDSTDSLAVEYSIDGGAWTTLIAFDGPTAGANVGWAEDTNFDGVGDGTVLTPTFTEFEKTITGTGSTLDMRVYTYANSGGEEFAFDFFRVFDSSTLTSGCTDPTALNYDPAAGTDDGSCYHISIDVFNYAFDPNPFTIEVGQTVRWINIGGTHNIDGTNDVLGGGTYSNPENFALPSGGVGTEWLYTFNVAGEYDYNCSIGVHASLGMVGSFTVGMGGCTDPAADNYDPTAEFDDGSCIISGCTDPTALNYNPDANNEDGSCIYTLPALVINEIHYNPCTTQGSDGDFEFLEIYNNDVVSVDLTDYTMTFNGTLAMTFPAATTIAPGEYIVVASTPLSYEGNGYQVFDVTGATGLGNGGSDVILADNGGNTVDQVIYSDTTPWPTTPDGGCTSLELIDVNTDNNDAANWQASYVSNGTPGAANSEPAVATPYTIQEIQTVVTTGETVLTEGVVTCVYSGSNLFTIQDGTGANSGVWVDGAGVAVGDSVSVEGVVSEVFDLTTILSSSITIINSGNALPAAEVLGTFAVNDEQWEGVYVETTGACDNNSLGFGEWSVDDGSGPIVMDDLNGVDFSILAELGATYTITGPLYYSFGAFKITPCDNATDIQKWGCTDPGAVNYDADAVIEDGSCSFTGCTYDLADNYNPLATDDDGSCTFDGLSGGSCPGDADGNNVVNILDLVAVSSNFGNSCP